MYLVSKMSRPDLGLTQPPIQWLPQIKWPRCEADSSPPPSAEVRNKHSYAVYMDNCTFLPSYFISDVTVLVAKCAEFTSGVVLYLIHVAI